MFSVHTSPEDFKNAPITDYFGFKLGQENHVVIVTSLFSKSSVFKIFLSTCTRKPKDGVFKFLRFNLESVFVIRFRDGFTEDGRLNRINKAVFFNFSGKLSLNRGRFPAKQK